jgi:hypothetical protein
VFYLHHRVIKYVHYFWLTFISLLYREGAELDWRKSQVVMIYLQGKCFALVKISRLFYEFLNTYVWMSIIEQYTLCTFCIILSIFYFEGEIVKWDFCMIILQACNSYSGA